MEPLSLTRTCSIFCDQTATDHFGPLNGLVSLKPLLIFLLLFLFYSLSTEWVDYVEEPMKYQALRLGEL